MGLLSNLSAPSNFLPLVVIALIGWYLISTVYSWYRLRHIPGPFLASISNLWLGLYEWRGRQDDIFQYLTEKYGSIVRIGPNDILIDDPEIIRRMSGVKSKYGKSVWYTGVRINPYHSDMFETLEAGPHDEIKARVRPGYSGHDEPALEADIDALINNLTSLVQRYVTTPGKGEYRPLELARVLPLFVLDAISKLSLGKEFGNLKADKDLHDFYGAMSTSLPGLSLAADVPWIQDAKYSWIGLKLFGPKVTASKGMGKVLSLANEATQALFKPGADKSGNYFVASFIRHGLTQTQCEAETAIAFIAGSDTTATAMRTIMLYIMTTPRVYQRLKSEIASAVRDGRVSRPISNAESRELPYLQAVIFEGLRMRASTMSRIPKTVPKGGDTINGKFLPEGTAIGTNQAALLRSKAAFGKDADVFRPERFLEVDDAARVKMQRHVELGFGYGRWMCAGKHIAQMELNKVFFELLRYFDFQLVNPRKPMATLSYIGFLDRGLHAIVTKSDIDV
ncbi:cytochrome P450 [Hypoxylon sp. NC1633]|nr:cytochrome P450 [Hypoxylon sp. NC1633]